MSSQTWPVKLADGSTLWLTAGLLVVVSFGSEGTQVARIEGPARNKYEAVRARKFRAKSRSWTGKLTVPINAIRGEAEEDESPGVKRALRLIEERAA